MWRWAFAAMLVGCESAEDFPGPPAMLEWSTMELAVRRGTLDGTGYEIAVPAGTERTSGLTTTYDVNGLVVTIELDPEARAVDEIVYDAAPDLRDDGWSATTASVAYNYVYIDEGGLLCKATAPAATSGQVARMQRICSSLRATTALANPRVYPEGLTPSRVRAAMCQIAMHHVRALEPAPEVTKKKKKTNEQRAADARRVEELDAAYSARQTRCERHRWSTRQTQCLVQSTSIEDAKQCVAAGW